MQQLIFTQMQQNQASAATMAAAASLYSPFMGYPAAAMAALAASNMTSSNQRIAPRGVDQASSWAAAASGALNQQPTQLPRRVKRRLEGSGGSRESRRDSFDPVGEASTSTGTPGSGVTWTTPSASSWIPGGSAHTGPDGDDSSDTPTVSGSHQDGEAQDDLDGDNGGGGGGSRDPAYYERRRKNNEAAKRSRDTRRLKEEEVRRSSLHIE